MNDYTSKQFDCHKENEGTKIDTLTAYVHDLKQHGAVAPCDDTLKMFAMHFICYLLFKCNTLCQVLTLTLTISLVLYNLNFIYHTHTVLIITGPKLEFPRAGHMTKTCTIDHVQAMCPSHRNSISCCECIIWKCCSNVT